MEYIQGIPHKLRAFDAFLSAYPEWRQKVVMLLVFMFLVSPSFFQGMQSSCRCVPRERLQRSVRRG